VIKPSPISGDDRHPITSFPFPDPDIPSFDFLQRIEWKLPFSRPYSFSQNYCRESLITFRHIMRITPNLIYLSLSGGDRYWFSRSAPAVFSDLDEQARHLRVLRIDGINNGFLEDVAKWNLPNLTHLITDSFALVETIKPPQVSVLELLQVSNEAMSHILTKYREVQEPSHTLADIDVPEEDLAPNLRCVRLRSLQGSGAERVILYLDWSNEQHAETVRC
jgi:hypothetical protein